MTEHQERKMLDEEFEEEKKEFWIHLAVALGFTIGLATALDRLVQGFPLGFNIPLLNEPATVSLIIYHVTVIGAGAYIGYIGLRELIVEKRFSVEFLMAVAGLGAAYLDFLFEGAMVLFLYSLAEYFEDYIEDRARKTVKKLSAYMPEEANVVEDSSEKTVDVKEVDIGTTILVKPGERIPLDATVIDGFSYVDQSLVTGESIPVFKKAGDNVFAGTLNTNGVLKLNVTKRTEETLVSRIVKLVMQSRKRKANIEKLVGRFARVYVPIVISLAVFTAVFMPTIAGGTYQSWIYRSLILLVVSCPSAFIVSVPATIFTAVTVAARKGVIIKGGVYVEKMAKVKAVVFDKTGTLTLGTPAVCEINKFTREGEKLLAYAAALEQYSNHPIAEAIVRNALENGLNIAKLEVKEVREIPGKGVVGIVDGARVLAGNKELIKEFDPHHKELISNSVNDKHTTVYVSVDNTLAGMVCLLDDVRGDAVQSIKTLKEHGIHTVMLTGDKKEIAEEVAKKLDLNEVHAELFPEDKLRMTDQLKLKYGMVAMVGDGINDAPVLAASDVGIAMGGGVDVALESADIVLVKDELIKIPYIHRLSNLTVTIAKQNIVVSLAMKFLLGALGFMGLIPLWFTVAAGDDGLTMLVLLNTLRLVRVKT